MRSYAKLASDGTEAVDIIKGLHRQGYTHQDIYVLTHERTRTNQSAAAADAKAIGTAEEGLLESAANLFRSRGDELRSRIESMGFGRSDALWYESELDRGKVLVIAKH